MTSCASKCHSSKKKKNKKQQFLHHFLWCINNRMSWQHTNSSTLLVQKRLQLKYHIQFKHKGEQWESSYNLGIGVTKGWEKDQKNLCRCQLHDCFLPLFPQTNKISFNHLFKDYFSCCSVKATWTLQLYRTQDSTTCIPYVVDSERAKRCFIDLKGLLQMFHILGNICRSGLEHVCPVEASPDPFFEAYR